MRVTLSLFILFASSLPLKASDGILLIGEEQTKSFAFTIWNLSFLNLTDLSRSNKGSVTLPTDKLIVRPNIRTEKIAYYSSDSARTSNWLEIGEINSLNNNNKKHIFLTTKETEIKDFYWQDDENLIVQISHYNYSPSNIDEFDMVQSIDESHLISYNINTNELDSLFSVKYNFELISSNAEFIFILHDGLSKLNPQTKEIIRLGKYQPHGFWPDARLQYALIQPHRPTITHFVRLEDHRTYQVPEYNDNFLSLLKSTEINDFSFRYNMDHINWWKSKSYYAFTPIPEPKVFVNLRENKYKIFEYDFTIESSKTVYEMTLKEYFDVEFSPILVTEDRVMARKFINDEFVYCFINLISKKETIVFRTDYLGKVKIFNSEYARQ